MQGTILFLPASRIDMLPLERRQSTVHDDGCHPGVGDVAMAAIANGILSSLGRQRKSEDE
jgi:hypothetical protein